MAVCHIPPTDCSSGHYASTVIRRGGHGPGGAPCGVVQVVTQAIDATVPARDTLERGGVTRADGGGGGASRVQQRQVMRNFQGRESVPVEGRWCGGE
ncbi:hypothetical protein E2C01_059646 [Portunus trituberculatus]|uniref:Uncharacterized protein n=1 Tax=Portunus trituberculatus TaxID=210409 RepID=A0A5B7GYY7_PORTR|nr:hypothetical protein [Portunus trituberculatus]